ncbi:MAG: hypothetical protein WBQ72_01325 [Terriglobales bacterium]
MKTTLFVLSMFFATAALGQQFVGGYLNGQPQPYHSPEHPQHASYTAIAQETSLYPNTGYPSAQGDRPASDFPQLPSPSLGEVARELRRQHALVKKAPVIWENQ